MMQLEVTTQRIPLGPVPLELYIPEGHRAVLRGDVAYRLDHLRCCASYDHTERPGQYTVAALGDRIGILQVTLRKSHDVVTRQ